ncbi:hypothetical protein [Endozoicomonas ascidiicola]|uniref:hypothetical protein n=1 Tax=Endozoicomonas ascidiicola TaxID=1698521 RepID=UPI00082E4D14|nr:hypothetical protein [Endozoicomonas ascidiicola]
MSGLSIGYDRRQASRIQQDIGLLSLPAASRKRVFKNAGRRYLKASRDNIRQQKTTAGNPFEKRKYGRGKLLKNMGKSLKFFTSPNHVNVTWPNKSVAKMGYRQQFGIDEVMTAERMVKIHGQPDYQAPATKKQAKALLDAGFTISGGKKFKTGPKKGKARRKRPSQRWIMDNMKLGQAGLIIRTLRNTTNAPRSWKIPVPARPFLGMVGGDAARVLTDEIEKERQRRAR